MDVWILIGVNLALFATFITQQVLLTRQSRHWRSTIDQWSATATLLDEALYQLAEYDPEAANDIATRSIVALRENKLRAHEQLDEPLPQQIFRGLRHAVGKR